MTLFDELVTLRAELQEFTKPSHEPSLRRFYDAEHGWFNLSLTPRPVDDDRMRHVTTTMTCIESLYERTEHDARIDRLPYVLQGLAGNLECEESPEDERDEATDEGHLDRRQLLINFASKALDRPAEWKSDQAAYVYCRVRTLGAMLRLLSEDDFVVLDKANQVQSLLADAWASRDPAASFGLREATKNPRNDDGQPDREPLTGPPSDETYPPNAFLTYWGLLALDKLPDGFALPSQESLRRGAIDWLDKSLAQQIAFHYDDSRHADPQQLAWSLCAHVRFGTDDIASRTTTAYTQLTGGLKAFFAQQNNGGWDQGQPLFHYPSAGNAYCYVYETLAELVSLATRTGAPAQTLRESLLTYLSGLRSAFHAARDSRQNLGSTETWGWSSGHHPHRTKPEGWATASVYRFAESLRRLVGVWANEEAKNLLGARTATETRGTLAKRGGTWDVGDGSAGGQLATTFLHHIVRAERIREVSDPFVPDPDVTVIPRHGARSALLFGPPGTGKTTLVRAVAGSLRWPFIEITPAQFLDAGVDLASKRADEIFRQVMQLNRCVVLLDEIDELIQARTPQAETTERFFTTTMLPRLAHLWETGRILFFVNTNDVARVDAAIRRGQRFDSAIFVMPPGFEAKRRPLPGGPELGVEEAQVTSALKAASQDNEAADAAGLAWLALLRYDQIPRFGRALKRMRGANGGDDSYTADEILAVLPEFVEELRSLDWSQPGQPPLEASDFALPGQVTEMLAASRRDHNVRLIAELSDDLANSGSLSADEDSGSCRTLPEDVKSADDWARGLGLQLRPDGVLTPP